MKEAAFYRKLEDRQVDCVLCAQKCRIASGKRGKCGVRENREGVLHSLVYGQLIARNVDPIEKKPLFHFLPGTRSYSIATMGCNFRCRFCQNADISQVPRTHQTILGSETTPEEVVGDATRKRCASIAYTYTEPTIFMEYALDVARLARQQQIANVFVSNGYTTEEGFDEIKPYLDAANIDLKAFRDSFYHEQCGAHLQPVLDTLERMKAAGVWLEVTTLIIPGLNDDPEELRELAQFIASLGPETPWHVSRFHPTYLLTDRPPTPVKTLRRARDIGLQAGLHYVYTGNIPGDDGESTYCPHCGEMLIERIGFSIKWRQLAAGRCQSCGAQIAGIGLK
jgi:pyruvate formate lyase activating enzyme